MWHAAKPGFDGCILPQGNTHILAEGSGQWQGVSVGESVVQPLFVYEVGLGEESVQDAVHALGQRGERLILTTRLEVRKAVLPRTCRPPLGNDRCILQSTGSSVLCAHLRSQAELTSAGCTML